MKGEVVMNGVVQKEHGLTISNTERILAMQKMFQINHVMF